MKPTSKQVESWAWDYAYLIEQPLYEDYIVQRAFAAALEEAAKICDSVVKEGNEMDDIAYASGAANCAEAIRKEIEQ